MQLLLVLLGVVLGSSILFRAAAFEVDKATVLSEESPPPCNCTLCPGFGGSLSVGYVAGLLDPICPPLSSCPKPPRQKTNFSYCYGLSADNAHGTCDCHTGRFFPESVSKWIDPDTPIDVSRMKSKSGNGREYPLVFSDEFAIPGRQFQDGADPKWTALRKTPRTNEQISAYRPEHVSTEGGKLKIAAALAPKGSSHGLPYETAMLQSWNKFCFTGGIVDIKVKLPGNHAGKAAALWPAIWMMGNLARAPYMDSTEGVWPFSAGDTCPKDDKGGNSIDAQLFNACNKSARRSWKPGYDQARGAPEIDIMEVMSGDQWPRYEDRIASGLCQAPSNENFENFIISPRPYIVTTFPASPGIPKWSLRRPEKASSTLQSGCLWSKRGPMWHRELYPEQSDTYPTFRAPERDLCKQMTEDDERKSSCPTMPNIDHYSFFLKNASVDFMGAVTHLPESAFEEGLRIRLEWNAQAHVGNSKEDSKDIFLAWYINDMTTPVFQLPASVLLSMSSKQGEMPPWRLEPMVVPREPMYLIMNVDMSASWGWPECYGCTEKCRLCTDCHNEECIKCRPEEQQGFLVGLCEYLKERPTMEVDYVRVYSDSATCEPPAAPTKSYIGENAANFFDAEEQRAETQDETEPPSEYPLKNVQPGGGLCDNDDACGGSQRGTCDKDTGRCICSRDAETGSGWTGPTCLVQTAGASDVCAFFLEVSDELVNPLLRKLETCQAPSLDPSGGMSHWYTPSTGELVAMTERNCGRVLEQYRVFEQKGAVLVPGHSVEQRKKTLRRYGKAVSLCRLVLYDGVLGECRPDLRANIALKAFGGVASSNKTCCNLVGQPYCTPMQLPSLFRPGYILLFLIISCMFIVTKWTWNHAQGASESYQRTKVRDAAPEKGKSLREALEQEFLSSSIGQEYPQEANMWFALVCGAFDNLAWIYGFQDDSVRNQFQHFVSLWESQLALARDNNPSCSDSSLLQNTMCSLHSKLLDGYNRWANRMDLNRATYRLYERRSEIARLAPIEDTIMSWQSGVDRMLELRCLCVECAAYLLVWGEAGVLRFSPELICFIVDCVLCDAGVRELSKGKRPGHFLRTVIRPIYNAIFVETYASVEVNPETKDDSKKLLPECVSFIPADKANYDDWNELFQDIDALNDRLMIPESGGIDLRTVDRGQRVKTLRKVNWYSCMGGYKTHREVHSIVAVFAAFHRIVFLHSLMFLSLVFAAFEFNGEEDRRKFVNGPSLLGKSKWVRISAGGLLASMHLLVDEIALMVIRPKIMSRWHHRLARFPGVVLPFLTYIVVRLTEFADPHGTGLMVALCLHAVVSAFPIVLVLFVPYGSQEYGFSMCPSSEVSCTQVARVVFWLMILFAKGYLNWEVNIISAHTFLRGMGSQVLTQPFHVVLQLSAKADIDFCFWALVWWSTFLTFCADSFWWFTVGNCCLGLLVALHHRSWRICSFLLHSPVRHLQLNMEEKLLYFRRKVHRGHFQKIWDAVIHDMYEDHKLTTPEKLKLSFGVQKRDSELCWTVPMIFDSSSSSWLLPANAEAKWRIISIARCLTLKMPRPFRTPNVPGLTVLIPHYGETILQDWANLVPQNAFLPTVSGAHRTTETPLLEWLIARHEDEWQMFLEANEETRHACTIDFEDLRESIDNKSVDSVRIIRSKIERWASMRTQTLWRTVAGICKYQDALLLLQGEDGNRRESELRQCFTCLLAMQRYASFDDHRLEQAEAMFAELPGCLRIAFIDHEDDNKTALDAANVHPRQHRRYFACLINRECPYLPDKPLRRQPKLRVELPGFPILGDGKGDNQNCAIIFSRGEFIQAIDANQGGYLEQMLLLPAILAEFRENPRRIVGAPEHITSDFGSIGDFAASSELAYGTIIQRSVAAQGARMHYGHPDLMNKIFMMHQGGVSKATKTINLSEDIFAGMDFVLRGGEIIHREYFYVTKGRDLGFAAVLSFFSKLSAGTGEQVLTRQVLRICRTFGMERVLPFYFNHAGFYITQFLNIQVIQWIVHVWLLSHFRMDATDSGHLNRNFKTHRHQGSEDVSPFGLANRWLEQNLMLGPMLAVILVNSLPLLIELWCQQGVRISATRYIKQMLTLAPIHFIFQGKVIGHYFSNEVLYGGAKYIATGRELPTHRRQFVGTKKPGLYQEFAEIAHYDGARLLLVAVCVCFVTCLKPEETSLGWSLCLGLVIVSWLWAPYLYNPYQFHPAYLKHDFSDLWKFFVANKSLAWTRWTESLITKRHAVNHVALETLCWFAFIWPVHVSMKPKVSVFRDSYPQYYWEMLMLMFPFVYISVVPLIFGCLCHFGLQPRPLVASALCAFLWLIDVGLCTYPFLLYGWVFAFLNSVVYRLMLLELWMIAAEFFLRVQPNVEGVKCWLLGCRLIRDLLTAATIMGPLVLLSLEHRVRMKLCTADGRGNDRCELHNLFVFRAFGVSARRHESERIDGPIEMTWVKQGSGRV